MVVVVDLKINNLQYHFSLPTPLQLQPHNSLLCLVSCFVGIFSDFICFTFSFDLFYINVGKADS